MSPDTFTPRLPLCEQLCLVVSIPSADTALVLYVMDDFPTRLCLPLPVTLQAIRKSRFTIDVRPIPGYFLKERFIGKKKIKFYHHDLDPDCNTDPDTGASRMPHKYSVRQSVPPSVRVYNNNDYFLNVNRTTTEFQPTGSCAHFGMNSKR